MKIAIPAFDSKVSPRFDTSQELVLLEVIDGNVINQERQPLQTYSVSEKIRTLLEQGVDTLICGGIDRLSRQQLGFNRIEVYSWVTGEIEDAVSCFLRNGLNSGTILGSNGRKEGRWQFRQRSFLCNVLQKGANQTGGEVSAIQADMQNRRGPGRGGPGRGRGKGNGRDGAGCSRNGPGSRREKSPGGAGTGGRSQNRRGTGQGMK